MNAKLIYTALLLSVVVLSAWRWQQFDLPALKEPLLPPAVPIIQNANSEAQLKHILEHNLWDKGRGKINPPGEAALDVDKVTDARWVLKGIGYQQMHMPVAVIAVGTDVKMYHEGDVLPDGALLTRVMAGGIVIERNGEEQNVYLFKK